MPLDEEVMIVSFDSASVLRECLASIATTMPSARVAVREHSDHGDAIAATRAAVAATPLDVRVEHDPTNPGFGAGCNALAAGSTADWFLFLNPDTGIVTWPYDDGPPPARTIIGPLFTEAAADHFGRRYRVRDEIRRSWLRHRDPAPEGVGFVSGAALLVDADSFRSVDGFDERYFLFYEDIDFCLRANRHGIATIVDPAWRVHHSRGHSTRSHRGDALRWSYESACRFHDEQGSPVRGYQLYVAADAALRAMVHLVRRDRAASRGYSALLRRALSDCVRGRSSRP